MVLTDFGNRQAHWIFATRNLKCEWLRVEIGEGIDGDDPATRNPQPARLDDAKPDTIGTIRDSGPKARTKGALQNLGVGLDRVAACPVSGTKTVASVIRKDFICSSYCSWRKSRAAVASAGPSPLNATAANALSAGE